MTAVVQCPYIWSINRR